MYMTNSFLFNVNGTCVKLDVIYLSRVETSQLRNVTPILDSRDTNTHQ